MFPSEMADQYTLRFPPGMRQAVKIEAARQNRSMSSEIIYRLIWAYEQDGITICPKEAAE